MLTEAIGVASIARAAGAEVVQVGLRNAARRGPVGST